MTANRDRFSKARLKEVLAVAFPASLEAIFQTSFSFVDQIIVGLLGASAVAAVGLSNSVSFVLILLYSAMGTGAGVLVARAYGRHDAKKLAEIAALALGLSAIFGIGTAIPLILFPTEILRMIGGNAELIKTGSGYFQLFAAAAPMSVMSAVASAVFRSMGDARSPMFITISAVVLNTLLGFALVLGMGPFPRLGVLGAGLASLVSQSFRCGSLLLVLHRKGAVNWYALLGTASLENIGPLLRLTFPLALSETLWGTSTFVYTIVFAHIGTNALAASQIVTAMENILIVAASGLAPAAVASVGQAIGKGSSKRAKSSATVVVMVGLICGLALSILLSLVCFLLPVLYSKVGAEVLHLAFWGGTITAAFQIPKVLNNIFGSGILPSAGDTVFVLLSHVVGSYALGLPGAVLLALVIRWSPLSVFGSRGMEEVVKTALFVWRYRRRWSHRMADRSVPQ